MANSSSRETRLWSAAGLCLLLVYSSLSIARPIAEYLRGRNLLRPLVASAFILAAALVLGSVLRRRPKVRVWLTLALLAGGYLSVLLTIPMLPEERLHFLEYGLFAGLVYSALRERQRRGARTLVSPVVGALALTFVAGWVDEGIQAILPNRVYDPRDVAFNTAAGLLCLVSMVILERVMDSE